MPCVVCHSAIREVLENGACAECARPRDGIHLSQHAYIEWLRSDPESIAAFAAMHGTPRVRVQAPRQRWPNRTMSED